MYNQAAVQQLPNQPERATLRSYLNCAQFAFLFYGVFQVFYTVFLITEGGIMAASCLVVSVVAFVTWVRCRECKKMLEQRALDTLRLRSAFTFCFCIARVLVFGNIAMWTIIGFLFYSLVKGYPDMKQYILIYVGVVLGVLLALSPFFVLMAKTGAVKKALEVVCNPANAGVGTGSFNAPGATQPLGSNPPAPPQTYNNQQRQIQGYNINNYGNGGFGAQDQGGYQTGPQNATQAQGVGNQNFHSPI